VIVSNQFSCKDTATVTINVWRKPMANAGPDKKINEGQTVMLHGAVSGTDVSFNWTPSVTMTGSNTLSPLVQPTSDFIYTLHAVSNLGCGTASDDVFVRVFKKVEVPNAFSPNGDGINDTWVIESLETYPEALITVFNRHGQKVYYSRGYSKAWDGKLNQSPLPIGTYYYVIDLQNGFPLIKGWLYLAR
jgi:gliding motility-associated-like protein